MAYYVEALSRLVEQFMKIPSVGRKTAQRMAFHVLNLSKEDAENFANAIMDAHDKIHKCSVCFNLTEGELCPVCSNPKREKGLICVVEGPRDVIAIERTREYSGVYHVLHGVISPMNGIGPEQITVKELVARVAGGEITEIIMATNPTVEGDTTAMYIAKLLKPFEVKVTRLAYGIPVGADLEYADDVTLMRALEGRTVL
ncbi:MAG: Recombination protein RecR [Firmicutes bacterium ADurb.Bin300]|jgi:recombination protein RecR|nr:MAG: Recombination protein RecR [Firmicutes bacterium ADurb.Bin300]HOD02178.1 recombination mediator RecR [Clostridiales bacterium]